MIPLLLLMWLYVRRIQGSGSWVHVCDKQLLPYLLSGDQKKQSVWRVAVIGIVGLLSISALAGPVWKQLPQPVFRSQASLVILLDLSRSMDVTDVKPSRLQRARHKILDILKKRKEGQTALIVYALEPFIVSPLTQDAKTVASLTNDLSTDLMPFQGSYPDKAINKAIDLLKQASVLKGQILLITDSVESRNIRDVIVNLKNSGHRLSILGVGTRGGAPIADTKGGFVKDSQGAIVVTKLVEEPLKEYAKLGGGRYHILTPDDEDINWLIDEFSTSRLSDEFSQKNDALNVDAGRWREEGPWMLLLLLPLTAIIFRKGYLAVVVLLVLPVPNTTYAFDWERLWKNNDQRAEVSFKKGEVKEAAELFSDPQWKAAASYRAQDYEKALESLNDITTPEAFYNKGNAFAKLGQLEEAIQSYDEALKINPEHDDAKYNKELLQDMLTRNQQQNNDSQSDQQQGQDQQGQQHGESQQSQQQSQEQQGENQQQSPSASQGSAGDNNVQQQESGAQAEADQGGEGQDDDKSESHTANNKDKENRADEQNEMQQLAEQRGQEEGKQDQTQIIDQQQDESTQAAEQWLRRIPDDPGGLLRRKFRYQSQLNANQANRELRPW
ncbi:MAG: VWA domain-containing protein [Gammaproteobacteria bacterium]|nr:VWA domain-containing protein [Gammaproteobacteria bacterium]